MRRSLAFTAYFFLIILAYYQIKPLSRSVVLSELGRDAFPPIWILTALILASLLPIYRRVLSAWTSHQVVRRTTCTVAFGCAGFWLVLQRPSPFWAVVFYVFVDIFSVVLVEQFWSVVNSASDFRGGARSYGVVGSGGLLGGTIGGALASWLVESGTVGSVDLLLVSAGVLVAVTGFLWMFRLPVREPVRGKETAEGHPHNPEWRMYFRNPTVVLLAGLILITQLAEPFVEFLFLGSVHESLPTGDAQTAYIASVYSVLGGVALVLNLLVAPLLFRTAGILGGLLLQPLAIVGALILVLYQGGLASFALLKVMDRGVSYSVNRAAKELLYLRFSERTIYLLKAIIDMFGYRAFKIVGAGVIFLLTVFLQESSQAIIGILWGICLFWLLGLLYANRRGGLKEQDELLAPRKAS